MAVSRYFARRLREQAALPSGDDAAEVLALGYVRVSKKAQAGRTSPKGQRHEIAQYINRRGWEPGEVFEDHLQGWRNDRPSYLRLREEIRYLRKQGRLVTVVAVNFDRTGRLAEEMLSFGRELDGLGVELHLVDDNGVLTGDGRFLKAFMAEKETEKLRDRVSRARRTVARANLPASGPAPWGYYWRLPVDEEEARRHTVGDGFKRILDAHPDEAPFVREAFAKFAGGIGKAMLASWVAGLSESARGGRNLNMAALMATLRNPVYIGRRVHPQVLTEQGVPFETPEDVLVLPKSPHWPALIDDATWLAVQQRFGDPKQTRRGRPANRLLTGLLRCPECGTRMAGGAGTMASGRERLVYRCESGTMGAGKANRHCSYTVSQQTVEAQVWQQVGAVVDAVLRLSGDPRLRVALEREWERLRYPDTGEIDATAQEIARVQARLATIKRGLAQALAKKLAGDQDDEEYEAAADILREERRTLEAELERLGASGNAPEDTRETLPPLHEALARIGGWRGALAAADMAKQRDLLAFLCDRIVPTRIGYGKYDVKLHGPVYEALRDLAATVQGSLAP